MKRGLIVLALLLSAAQAPVSQEKAKPEAAKPTADQTAQQAAQQLKAALTQCQSKVGELTMLIDGVQDQINNGAIGATKQVQSATIAALLKRIEEKNPQYALNVATGEITVKKESGK